VRDTNGSIKGVLLGLAVLTACALLTQTPAQAAPTFHSAIYFGGPGDESGTGIAIAGEKIYVSGTGWSYGLDGLLARYSLPPTTSPEWYVFWANQPGGGLSHDQFYSLGVSGEGVYAAANSDTVGSDWVGGHEGKATVVKFPLDGPPGGGLGGCTWYATQVFFGGYCGWEGYKAVLPVQEGASEVVYASGFGQTSWWNNVALLAKYDSAGTLLWWRVLGDPAWNRNSRAADLAWLDGYLYVAGGRSQTGQTPEPDPNQSYADLWKYDSAGDRIWVRSFNPGTGAGGRALAAGGDCLYVAGYTRIGPSGNQDVLLLKYDQDGDLLWSQDWGGAGSEWAEGVAVAGDRVYVVGCTSSFGADGWDTFLLEADPADGTILSATCWGGAADDMAYDVAATASDVYVVGHTASFGAGGNDLMLLRYTLVIPVEVDIKPGSYPNAINLGSQGVIPVAILSSDTFDATQVNPTTVSLAGAGVAVRGKGKYLAHKEDVNGDGRLDLVAQVETENLAPAAFQDGSACVTGETYGGQQFEGWDEITIVPPE